MLTAYELFGFMSPGLAGRILEDTAKDNRPVYETTLASVAQGRRLRPEYLKRQPRNVRHQFVLECLRKPGFSQAATSLIQGWLLKQQVELLKQFLDALGITHENGVVENLPASVADDRLEAAIAAALERHEREIVILYLHAFHTMNNPGWTNLQTLLERDARLQLV